jgi:hypothetical protein
MKSSLRHDRFRRKRRRSSPSTTSSRRRCARPATADRSRRSGAGFAPTRPPYRRLRRPPHGRMMQPQVTSGSSARPTSARAGSARCRGPRHFAHAAGGGDAGQELGSVAAVRAREGRGGDERSVFGGALEACRHLGTAVRATARWRGRIGRGRRRHRPGTDGGPRRVRAGATRGRRRWPAPPSPSAPRGGTGRTETP